MEKSVCRTLVCTHPDLYLLPACFDRWRAFVRMRQIWKFQIDFVDEKVKKNLYLIAVEKAFNKMKYDYSDREAQLKHICYPALQQKIVENYNTLNNVADSYDTGSRGVVDYTN